MFHPWPNRRMSVCLATVLAVFVLPLSAEDKPAEAERALRQQRVEVLREAVKVMRQHFEAGRATSQNLLESSRRLFLAELEMATKPADRLALCDKFERLVKDALGQNEALLKAGGITDADYALARAACLEDEVFLLRERLRVREDKEGPTLLRKLLLERREAYQGALLALNGAFEAGHVTHATMLEINLRSLNANLETEEKPAARWALRQATADRLGKMEEYSRAQFEAGRASMVDHITVRAVRLTVEIDLQREKSGPRAERLAPFRRLLEERRDVARNVLALRRQQVEAGRCSQDVLVDAARMVFEAEMALAEKPADRVALLRKHLEGLKKAEEFARARYEVGLLSPTDILTIKAAQLDTEINLVRAQRAPQ